jgi:RND family efflux transporter MFP subunit
MKSKRIFTILIVIAIIGVIVFLLFRNKKTLDENKKPVDRSHVPVSVSLDTARVMAIQEEISLPATLAAKDEGNISAEISGRIERLNIELGTVVGKGQVVGHIDIKETQLKLEAAELSIEKLNRDYERNKILVAGNATNANAVTDAKYDLDSKKLEAAQLRSQIAKSNIVSPVSGVVTDKKMVSGEYVNAGGVIGTVVDVYNLKAKVYIPENKVMSIKAGQNALVTTESFPGEKFTGKVIFVSPKGDDNHNYLAELLIENKDGNRLKAGLYVQVLFAGKQQREALQIQKIALVEGTKNPYVYVAQNGKAVEKKIITGRENGEYIEVLSGLSNGEHVITSGLINILPGSFVQSIDQNKK